MHGRQAVLRLQNCSPSNWKWDLCSCSRMGLHLCDAGRHVGAGEEGCLRHAACRHQQVDAPARAIGCSAPLESPNLTVGWVM